MFVEQISTVGSDFTNINLETNNDITTSQTLINLKHVNLFILRLNFLVFVSYYKMKEIYTHLSINIFLIILLCL